jgi:hypothetical protein
MKWRKEWYATRLMDARRPGLVHAQELERRELSEQMQREWSDEPLGGYCPVALCVYDRY